MGDNVKSDTDFDLVRAGDKLTLKPKGSDSPYSITYDNDIMSGGYWDYMNIPILLCEKPKDALIIGLGGGTIVRQYEQLYDINIDVVEVDNKIVDIARDHFNVTSNEKIRIIKSDGKQFLLDNEDEYDIIIVDAFVGEKIPTHLRTLEFFDLVRRRLRKGGVCAVNTLIGDDDTKISNNISKNLNRIFSKVYRYTNNDSMNRILIALKQDVDMEDLIKRLENVTNKRLTRIIADCIRMLEPFRIGKTVYDNGKTVYEKGEAKAKGYSLAAD